MTTDAAKRRIIDETIAIARVLLDLLHEEARALAAMKIDAPTGFAEAKHRLSLAYAGKLKELKDSGALRTAEPVLGDLLALNEAVRDAARRNAAQLQGAMEANRRLIAIMRQAADRPAMPIAIVIPRRAAARAAMPTVSAVGHC